MTTLQIVLIVIVALFVFFIAIAGILIFSFNRNSQTSVNNNQGTARKSKLDFLFKDNVRIFIGFVVLTLIAAILFPKYAAIVFGSKISIVLILGILILILAVGPRKEWKQRYDRRLLFLGGIGLVALAVLWPMLPAIQPNEEEKAFKKFMNYEKSQAKNHPYQKYEEEIEKIYAIDPKTESTLVKRISENQALVTISGNNEYFKNPDYPLGHDTTATISPRDSVLIKYASGKLSYNQYGHGNKIPVWGGYNFSLMRPGESIRYQQELSSLAVFAILRRNKQEQVERFQIGHLEIRMQNNFSHSAKLYLFYNTKEKFRGNDHSIQDGFPHAGADGSRMSFIIELIRNKS